MSISFTANQVAQSSSIDLNNGTITTAKLTSTETSGSFDYYMKATDSSVTPTIQYKCNDNAASTAVDDAMDNNEGTCQVNTDTISDTGAINDCLKLRSTDARFTLASTRSLVEGDTICFWIKPRVASNGYVDANAYKNGYYPVAGHDTDTHDSCIDLQVQRVHIQDRTGNGYQSDDYTVPWDTSTFYHIAIVFNSTNTKFYVNGVAWGTGNPFGVETLDIVHFGRGYSGSTNGESDLDDIRIYDAELTAAEVSLIYNSGTGNETKDVYFEPVTSGVAKTFVNSGTNLKWRAEENAGSTGTITKLIISDYH